MSNGTLQQLASKGVQDGHLSISPETSFFKRTYKRCSSYAIEAIDSQIPSCGWDKEFTQQISRNGDLLSETWLVFEIQPARLAAPGPGELVYFTNTLGHAMLKSVGLDIGNNEIDSTTGAYMEIRHELESSVDIDVDELVLRGKNPNQLFDWTYNGNTLNSEGQPIIQIWTKIPFYYAKARSQALPIVALQYHDIRVKFRLRSLQDVLVFNSANTTLDTTYNGALNNGYMVNNFVYLDSMERRLFASNAHEYLIKNLQISDFHSKNSGATKVNAQVVFNHPVTSFFWYVQKQSNIDAKDYFNYERTAGRGDDTILSATIKFNGSEREKPRGPLFWRKVQPAIYFERTPRKNLYCYSFAQHPSSWFPSGSVNLSRIDVCSLEVTLPATDANGAPFGAADLTVFAENFNVIRIQGGMAAKKYAN